MKQVHGDDRLTTIVVGQGEHHIDGHYVDIASAMRIVGDPGVPKEKIVVVGVLSSRKGFQGTTICNT